MRNVYEILIGKFKGKRPLVRPRCRWDVNIGIHKEIRWEGVVCLQVAQGKRRGIS
jgi:hypothetical protein